MTGQSKTPLLDTVDVPADIRRLKAEQLRQLADELRQETISAVSVTGGHLGAGLGVVELTVALHYVFNTPKDRVIWDVGHQAYPHKIVTGPAQPHPHAAPGRRACRASRAAARANTTRSARPTPRPRFRPGWAWPWRAIWPAATIMWWP